MEDNYKPFMCGYEFDGQAWSIIVHATTLEEAEMKLKAISSGRVDGLMTDAIPA